MPPSRRAAPTHHNKWILATTILASSLAFVDGSVVNVALPAIGKSLQAGTDLQWVVSAYLLTLSALLLLGGAAGDRFGRRRVLVAGVFFFAIASVACAIAPSMPLLVTGRLAQGASAAFLMPNSLAILGETFSGEEKGRAVGIWAAAGAIMGAVGPVLGGWLVDRGSWRAIFVINVPIAAGAIFLAQKFVPVSRDEETEALDALGAALATAGLGVLTWGLAYRGILMSIVGLALLVALVVVEKRRGARAMLPLDLFGSESFIGLSLLTLLLYGALGGLFVLLPYVLIELGGYSGTAAGAALLPFPVLLAAASPRMGALVGKIGSRWPLTIGPVIVGAGFFLLVRVCDESASYATTVLPALLVIAIGMTGAVAPLTAAVLSSVDARHTGSASGLNSALARTGGLVATALLGTVLATRGTALASSFHTAAMIGAALCVASGVCAFVTLKR